MLGKQLIQAAAGAAGAGGGGLYVDDVFSTFLAVGAGGQTVTNGIDLATEGGMVWSKARAIGVGFGLHDTERGINKFLQSNSNNPQTDVNSNTNFHTINSFNTDGFTTGADGGYGVVDLNGYGNYVHWSFRKAPGFFDVVTYTGNSSSGQTISHNLGSAPGIMIIKSLSAAENWVVYSKDLYESLTGNFRLLSLNTTNDAGGNISRLNSTQPTSSVFTVGSDANTNGDDYVAYLFASDDASFGTNSDESIIKCGIHAHTTGFQEVNIGFEPQFVLFKKNASSISVNWYMFDNMRGAPTGGGTATLFANLSNSEDSGSNYMDFTPTGFRYDAGNFGNNSTMMYMAIRRPHKPPTAATEVFGAATQVPPSGNQGAHRSGFVADMAIRRRLLVTTNNFTSSRLLSGKQLSTNTSDAESAEVDNKYDYMNGYFAESDTSTDKIAWLFKRAPGFFDVVAFTASNTSTQAINHGLGAVPELFVVKKRDGTGSWQCYHKDLGNTKYVKWNLTTEAVTSSARWNNTTPTATQFTLGSEFQGTNEYVVYLFATLDGISKVGSYAGTGNNLNVDCGFSSGARFILIKRTDTDLAGTTGNWYVYDTTRGIVSGNDPYILLNTTGTQVTGTDYIDPLSSGFTVTSSAPVGLNASGGTYIFLAIA